MTNKVTSQDVEKNKKIDFIKDSLNGENLGLTEESQWEALADHVEVHKYLRDQKAGTPCSWEEAFASWKEKVYTPLIKVVDWWEVKRAFSDYSKGQLFFAVSTHWYYMLEKDPETAPEDAAVDFAAYYGKGVASWMSLMRVVAVMRARNSYAYY